MSGSRAIPKPLQTRLAFLKNTTLNYPEESVHFKLATKVHKYSNKLVLLVANHTDNKFDLGRLIHFVDAMTLVLPVLSQAVALPDIDQVQEAKITQMLEVLGSQPIVDSPVPNEGTQSDGVDNPNNVAQEGDVINETVPDVSAEDS